MVNESARNTVGDKYQGVRLSAVKRATGDIRSRVTSLEKFGRSSVAETALETGLLALFAILDEEDEAPRGWLRAALLAFGAAPTALDALAPTRLTQLQVRLQAIDALPDVMAVDSLRQMQDFVLGAINAGVLRYNAGDVPGCCAIYWAVATTLLACPASRGFPGYARAMGYLRSALEFEKRANGFDSEAANAYAWNLRRAFDAVLALQN